VIEVACGANEFTKIVGRTLSVETPGQFRSRSRPRRSKLQLGIEQATILANFDIDFKLVESSLRKVHKVVRFNTVGLTASSRAYWTRMETWVICLDASYLGTPQKT
jgi:hypothetical protein